MSDQFRLQLIHRSQMDIHPYLNEYDKCYFIGEYTAGRDYTASDINQVIKNIKINPSVRTNNPTRWPYKERDIKKVASWFNSQLTQEGVDKITFVPIPPSKSKTDPEYDDRMLQICWKMLDGFSNAEVTELLTQEHSMVAAHENPGHRPDPDTLIANYRTNWHPGYHPREIVMLVDDVITEGAHFATCRRVIEHHFPQSRVVGLFVARRVYPPPEDDFTPLF